MIESFCIFFYHDFNQFDNLINVLYHRKFKFFDLCNVEYRYTQIRSFLQKLVTVELWKELEILNIYGSPQAINFILNNANLPKLKTVELDCYKDDEDYDEYIKATAKLLTVRCVKMYFVIRVSRVGLSSYIGEFIKLFPGVAELIINGEWSDYSAINYSTLTNLRLLDIRMRDLETPKRFVKQLQRLPFLTRFYLFVERSGYFGTSYYGRHLNFPTLVYSNINADEKIVKRFVPLKE